MRTILIGLAAVAMAAGVALAQTQQGQQEQPATGQAAGQQGMGQGMGPGMMMGGYGMGPGMMGHGMMGRGMGHGMMMGGGMDDGRHMAMKRHMMLVMFALVDQDGNERLSLEEVQAVHARLFGYADADDDGELTMEELAAFMHGGPATGAAETQAQ
jgi:hypothetical protein